MPLTEYTLTFTPLPEVPESFANGPAAQAKSRTFVAGAWGTVRPAEPAVAAGVPPVRLVTRIGIAAQVPCQLSHSRRYTSVSATAEALVNDTDSCPVHVAPDASLDRVTV